jgi:hypothetical protein
MNRKIILYITIMVMVALTACNKSGSSGSAKVQSGGKTSTVPLNKEHILTANLSTVPINR